MQRIRERVLGEVERQQAGAGRGDMDARLTAVLGRHVDRPEVQAPDVGREGVAPDDPDQNRRDAILGRQRDVGQERDTAARDREDLDLRRQEDILGLGRSSARGSSQERNRGR